MKGGPTNVKKLLILALAMILALGMMGGAFAYFTDTETSSGNILMAGTLDLKIKGAAGWGDVGPVGEWTMSNMAPGVNTEFGSVNLRYEGTISGHHIEVGCTYTATEGAPYPGDTGTPDVVDTAADPDSFAKYVEITSFDYYGSGWHIKYVKGVGYFTSGTVPTVDGKVDADWEIDPHGDGIISLYDLYLDPLDNLPPPTIADVGFDMTVKFHENAGNDLQGDALNVIVTFTLNQDVSQ
jgi:spore coat-associated protein N